MYVVIVNEDKSVKEIIKNPTEEQKKLGYVISNLTDVGQFIETKNKIYYTKEND